MRRTILIVSALAALLVGAGAAQAATTYFSGIFAGRHVKPRSLELTADGTLYVGGVTWSSWGGRTATGHGNAEYHGCTPNCAQSKVHHARVTVHLSNVRICRGRRFYTHVALVKRSGRLLDPDFLKFSWNPCH